MALIYVVEDDVNIREIECFALKNSGYTIEDFECAKDFYLKVRERVPDLVLLDIMLPDEDGLEIVKKLRKKAETRRVPIILVTAKTSEMDKVKGLDIGADDYLTKPFATPELLARMRVVLRRQAAASGGEAGQASGEEVLSIKSLSMYIARHEVMVGNVPVELTKKEYDLLEYMLRNKRTVLSRDQILSNVWGYDYMGDTNVVDVYIRYLRQKLDDKFGEKYIHTMRGVGYVIKE